MQYNEIRDLVEFSMLHSIYEDFPNETTWMALTDCQHAKSMNNSSFCTISKNVLSSYATTTQFITSHEQFSKHHSRLSVIQVPSMHILTSVDSESVETVEHLFYKYPSLFINRLRAYKPIVIAAYATWAGSMYKQYYSKFHRYSELVQIAYMEYRIDPFK